METVLYTQNGKEAGSMKLPESVFGLPWNADLVHQVMLSMRSNERTPVAHAKTRAEVRGGGKKPWQQKGTGRARHGSSRSPIWVGGGTTHGPRNDRNYDRKINKRMKTVALFTLLSKKFQAGEILFVDTLSFAKPKTSEAKEVLSSFSGVKGFEQILSKRKNSALIALEKKDVSVEKSFNNLGNVVVEDIRNLNPLTVLNHKYLVITNPKESIKAFETKVASK